MPARYFLNERLMNDLRPTLFLAQLSNLLAGNISIVHGVSGSSRTFMGEEASGIDAARIALARIESGQSDIALVGAAQNGERKDLLMLFEFGDFNLTGKYAPVWARDKSHGGFALGSAGVFLVMESKEHAEARGAKALREAEQGGVRSARNASSRARSRNRWRRCGRSSAFPATAAVVITGATGVESRNVGRKGLPAPASRFCRAFDRHDLRPYHRSPVPARPCAGGTFDLARHRCFRPTTPPDSRLKRPTRRPRLSWWEPATGRAKAWPWSRRSSSNV